MIPAIATVAALVALIQIGRVLRSMSSARAGEVTKVYRRPLLMAHGGHETFLLGMVAVCVIGWVGAVLANLRF